MITLCSIVEPDRPGSRPVNIQRRLWLHTPAQQLFKPTTLD